MSKFLNNYLKTHSVRFENPRYFSNNMDNEAYKNKLHEVRVQDSTATIGKHFGSHKNLFRSHRNYNGRAFGLR